MLCDGNESQLFLEEWPDQETVNAGSDCFNLTMSPKAKITQLDVVMPPV